VYIDKSLQIVPFNGFRHHLRIETERTDTDALAAANAVRHLLLRRLDIVLEKAGQRVVPLFERNIEVRDRDAHHGTAEDHFL
jgi:hypothetical protein